MDGCRVKKTSRRESLQTVFAFASHVRQQSTGLGLSATSGGPLALQVGGAPGGGAGSRPVTPSMAAAGGVRKASIASFGAGVVDYPLASPQEKVNGGDSSSTTSSDGPLSRKVFGSNKQQAALASVASPTVSLSAGYSPGGFSIGKQQQASAVGHSTSPNTTATTATPLIPLPFLGLNILESARDSRDVDYLKDYSVFGLLNEAALGTMHTNSNGSRHADVLAAFSGACQKVEFTRSPEYSAWKTLQKDMTSTSSAFLESIQEGYHLYHDLPTVHFPDGYKAPSNSTDGKSTTNAGGGATTTTAPAAGAGMKKAKEHQQQLLFSSGKENSLHHLFSTKVLAPLSSEVETYQRRLKDLLDRTPPLIRAALLDRKPYLIRGGATHNNNDPKSASGGGAEKDGMVFEFNARQLQDDLESRAAILEISTCVSFLRNYLARIPWRLALGQPHQHRQQQQLEEKKTRTLILHDILSQISEAGLTPLPNAPGLEIPAATSAMGKSILSLSPFTKSREPELLDLPTLSTLSKCTEEGLNSFIRRVVEEKYYCTFGVEVLKAVLSTLETMKALPSVARHSISRLGVYSEWSRLCILFKRYLPVLKEILHNGSHWQEILQIPDQDFEHRLQLLISNAKIDDKSLYEVLMLIHGREDAVASVEGSISTRETERAEETAAFLLEVEANSKSGAKKGESAKGGDEEGSKKKKANKA